ncbi:MAG: Rne/Rng family ribonuclease, partial [Pseudomonadota bacterium]
GEPAEARGSVDDADDDAEAVDASSDLGDEDEDGEPDNADDALAETVDAADQDVAEEASLDAETDEADAASAGLDDGPLAAESDVDEAASAENDDPEPDPEPEDGAGSPPKNLAARSIDPPSVSKTYDEGAEDETSTADEPLSDAPALDASEDAPLSGDEAPVDDEAETPTDPGVDVEEVEARNPDEDEETEAPTDPDADDGSDDDNEPEASEATVAELRQRYEDARRARNKLLRHYKIQEVIKRRQILLVQAVKEERGNKGAALTTYLSLAGRYCVLMPNTARGGGISRKIANGSDRRRLRSVVNELEVPAGIGLIIRTAGAKRSKTEIKRDYEYLLRLWETIRDLTLKSIAPTLIYEEASLIKRCIRDLYDKDIESIQVQGEAGYREAKDFMRMLMPSHAKHVQPYKDRAPIFQRYKVEAQLDTMFSPEVRLKSGGYIVINQTEALVAIDVNSGKATRERNIEQTALRTNLEAAEAIARQCRLRDLAGLIVIDFIDMEESRNNRAVEKRFKDQLKGDRARIQVGRISGFGLLEMSRQRRRSNLAEGTTQVCPHCLGAGVIRSVEAAAQRVLRAIEEEALKGSAAVVTATATEGVAFYLLNNQRHRLTEIEANYGVQTEVKSDNTLVGDSFAIDRRGAPAPERQVAAVRPDHTWSDDPIEEVAETTESSPAERPEPEARSGEEDEDGGRRRRRRRRRRSSGEDTEGRDASSRDEAASSDEDDGRRADRSADSGEDDDDENGGRKRRRRGRRGGRRNRRRDGDQPEQSTADQDGQSADADAVGDTADAANAEAPDADDAPAVEAADAEAADPGAPLDVADAPGEETVAVEDPEPAEPPTPAEEPALESEPELAAVSSSPEPAPEAPPAKPKKARSGWWQRALGRDG